jgi:DNA-binding transcriptional ArsR family regulator
MRTMGDEEQTGGDILDALGDAEARRILAAINLEALSAKEIAERLDLSLPTVYRRLDMLESCDLVAARTLVAENGNHYKVFECNFESTVITLDGQEFKAQVHHEEGIPERFSTLWEEFGGD